ncbi:MAG: anhydro-N-acetylmuramic acid kinase [Halothiobacillus sp.]
MIPMGADLKNRALSGCFIGVMSGTSMDAVDACIVDFSASRPRVIAHHDLPLDDLRDELRALALGERHLAKGDAIDRLGWLDIRMAERISLCVNALLKQSGRTAQDIVAIGCHGQTIRHRPTQEYPFTLQIGDPNTIGELTGIPVITDFRRRDLAAGGQGAPLVPLAHQALFSAADPTQTSLIAVNLGGICNITVMEPDTPLIGFDTGPANTLLDAWVSRHLQRPFDENGDWAQTGTPSTVLLNQLLAEPFFRLPPPKSTGIEQFNLDWLTHRAGALLAQLPPSHVQATLTALTAHTLTEALHPWLNRANPPNIVLAGGGARNAYLIDLIHQAVQKINPSVVLQLSDELAIDPQCVECAAFAWLARQFLLGLAGNAPSVTGARGARVLGGFYPA